jgi:hypothetical protein
MDPANFVLPAVGGLIGLLFLLCGLIAYKRDRGAMVLRGIGGYLYGVLPGLVILGLSAGYGASLLFEEPAARVLAALLTLLVYVPLALRYAKSW